MRPTTHHWPETRSGAPSVYLAWRGSGSQVAEEAPGGLCNWGLPLFSFPWLWPHVSRRHFCDCSTDPSAPWAHGTAWRRGSFPTGPHTFAHSQPVHLHHSGPPGMPNRPEGAGEIVLRQCGWDSSWHRHTSLSCTRHGLAMRHFLIGRVSHTSIPSQLLAIRRPRQSLHGWARSRAARR